MATDLIPLVFGKSSGGAAIEIDEVPAGSQISPIWVAGLLGRNLLINSDMQINQRGFAGGALAAGVYGYDRWKAGTGGCNVSVNTSGVVTHTSGPLVQIVESPSGVYGANVTFSVQDPSGTVSVSVGGVSGSITAGSGRRSVTLAIPSGSGNLTVQISATSVTYRLPQLERGEAAVGYDARPQALEVMLCQRYYEKSYELSVSPGTAGAAAGLVQTIAVPPSDGGYFRVLIPYSATKRINPAVTLYSPDTGASGAARNAYSNADITGSVNAVGSSHHCVAAIPSQPTGNRLEMHFTADAEL